MADELSEGAKLDMAISRAGEHVGIPHHKVHSFLETLKMCGFELRPIEALPSDGDGDADK